RDQAEDDQQGASVVIARPRLRAVLVGQLGDGRGPRRGLVAHVEVRLALGEEDAAGGGLLAGAAEGDEVLGAVEGGGPGRRGLVRELAVGVRQRDRAVVLEALGDGGTGGADGLRGRLHRRRRRGDNVRELRGAELVDLLRDGARGDERREIRLDELVV